MATEYEPGSPLNPRLHRLKTRRSSALLADVKPVLRESCDSHRRSLDFPGRCPSTSSRPQAGSDGTTHPSGSKPGRRWSAGPLASVDAPEIFRSQAVSNGWSHAWFLARGQVQALKGSRPARIRLPPLFAAQLLGWGQFPFTRLVVPRLSQGSPSPPTLLTEKAFLEQSQPGRASRRRPLYSA